MNKWKKGLKTPVEKIRISETDVANYCTFIGESSALYKDKAYAIKCGYEGIPLPYTYASLFWQKLSIPWLANDDPVILVEQNFSYDFPLICGITYDISMELTNVRRIREQLFLYHTLTVLLDGIKQMTMKTTLLYEEQPT
ncbi:hypothetical protein [Pseudogracilibacillus sp. ICA-222130]|uniref:hypothetical protein n=1 Tax=Pseudogracilibacillus sp. ICA-222130 TaxID=3134655 RepID=UPI0030C368C0